MAEQSGFFPDVDGDREYTSDWLAQYIASFISNGTYDGELAVTADGSTMSVTLPAGRAWINGYYYRNDSNLVLPIDNADGILNRKDIIVLRWDVNERSITTKVIKGVSASTATVPEIVRDVEQYDLKLAEISIPAGTTAITQSLITDTRYDNDVCGIVHAVVDHIDTTALYNQIKDDLTRFRGTYEDDFSTWSAGQKVSFETWLDGIKNTLGEDSAGHLQEEIDAINTSKGAAGGIAGLDDNGKVPSAQLPAMDYVPNSEKGSANGVATLDAIGHVPAEQLNISPPNYAGTLVVHVATSDGGSLGDTKVQVTNTQLGSYYVQSLDALGKTTFELLDNHIYAVTLIDYPTQYYGGADTVQITGGETTTLNLEMSTEPDIIGWDYDTSTEEMVYTDGAANWIPATFDGNHHIQYRSFADSWLLRGIHSCLYKNGVVQYYLNEDDNSKKADGTDADITTGADGDVMVEFQKVYTKANTYTDTNNHLHYTLQMTKEALSGYYSIGFNNKDAVEQDTTYIAKYLAYRDENNKLHSLSGSSFTTDDYSTLFSNARNVGSGYNLFHDEQLQLICALFSMMFRTLKFEDVYPSCSYNTRTTNGDYNTSGLFNNNNNTHPKILGIENLGCASEVIEGKILTNRHSKNASDQSYYGQYVGYSVYPLTYWYNYSNSHYSTTVFESGLYPLRSYMRAGTPFSVDSFISGEKNVCLTNDIVSLEPISRSYVASYFICQIGSQSSIKGIFSEDYIRSIGYFNSYSGRYFIDSSYRFHCRLASIPV